MNYFGCLLQFLVFPVYQLFNSIMRNMHALSRLLSNSEDIVRTRAAQHGSAAAAHEQGGLRDGAHAQARHHAFDRPEVQLSLSFSIVISLSFSRLASLSA